MFWELFPILCVQLLQNTYKYNFICMERYLGTIYCYSKSYITLTPDSFELVINVFDFNSYKLMMILNFYV